MLRKKLASYKKKTVTLETLETFVGKRLNRYEDFAEEVLVLEREGILEMVKAKGRNNSKPSVAYQYRINTYLLNKEHREEIEYYRLRLHNALNLDSYFRLQQATWEADLPYLKQINHYIEMEGFPEEEAAAPERSFELVGDEKWITDHGGSEVLKRIGIWERLQIMPVADPLMFAIHPKYIREEVQLHLIVENKTTYQALLPALSESVFSTLIYGSGKKIIKSIENFPNQYPVNGKHLFYYFGDIDHTGLEIWHSLSRKQEVRPAIPFYKACLQKKEGYGKTNQRPNEEAMTMFLDYFSDTEAGQVRELFTNGAYYPQEVLATKELQAIWREWDVHTDR